MAHQILSSAEVQMQNFGNELFSWIHYKANLNFRYESLVETLSDEKLKKLETKNVSTSVLS